MDMHIHTSYSDGYYNVKEIIAMLKQKGIETFSITDHDSIESINDLKKCDLEFYNGIELSSKIGEFNIHILGYGFDPNNDKIKELCDEIKTSRIERTEEIIRILIEEKGIIFNDGDLKELYMKKTILGKVHIIDLMHKYGYGNTNREIYYKYLKDIRNTANEFRINSKAAIEAIKKAGGIAVLAHPKDFESEYNLNANDLIPWLTAQGLEGIEVYNSLHTKIDTERYFKMAIKHKLLISGGSDFHGGLSKPDVKLGEVTSEGLKIKQLSLVDHLRKR